MKALTSLVVLVAIATCFDATAQRSFLERIGLKKTASLADTEIADGLKEALTVGINNVVEVLRKEDGYFGSEEIKIPLPESWSRLESSLRRIGYGDELDEFVLSMNRAAEKAAPAARDIFVDAIVGMTIEDAQSILKGEDTAATDYFREHTSGPLTEAFAPIVEQRMSEFEVTQQYNAIVERYNNIRFLPDYKGDSIEVYTVERALDGLFHTLGKEEKKIREDPAAQVTDLLKKVFGD